MKHLELSKIISQNTHAAALVLFTSLLFSSQRLSAELITIADIEVAEGTSFVEIPILISGGSQIVDLVAGIVLVGDPNAALDGSARLKITDVSFVNSIFQNIESLGGDPILGFDFVKSSNFALPSGIIDAEANLLSPNTNFVTANGELFRVTLDTSALAAGETFAITMNTIALFGQAITFTRRDGSVLTPDFAPGGSLTMVSAIPEPNMLLAGSCAGLYVLTRRRRVLKS